MIIRRVGAELFRADRRADMTKLIVTFRNFAIAPKKLSVSATLRIYVFYTGLTTAVSLRGPAMAPTQPPV
jgi:hypothetical protein